MPQPTTGIHLAVSRSRLGQINDPLRNNVLVSAVKKALRESDSNPEDLTCLCLSEQSLLPLIAAGLGAGRVFVCEENFQFKTFLKMCAEKNGMKVRCHKLVNFTP